MSLGGGLFACDYDAACERLSHLKCTIHYLITPRVFLHLDYPPFAGSEAVQTVLRAVYEAS